MSRYDNPNGGNGKDYDDDTTLKLQEYAALRLTPAGVNSSTHDQYGTSFIANFEDAAVIDGIVMQREDKPGTWKIFSPDKFFHLNPEDGLVYETANDDGSFSGQMSAQDVLDHPRVAGFSENFGGTDYLYTPVGVVIEEASDIAVNDDLDVETGDGPAIEIGDASMLLGNKTWVRTFAKKITAAGDAVINDNGDDPTPRGEEDTNPKYDDHDWLNTDDLELRDELEGREIELWITEQTQTWDDGNETTFKVPNVMDVKTEEFVQIDNDISAEADAEGGEEAKATDGGTATQSADADSGTESPDSTTDADGGADDGGLPEGVPDNLEDLIDFQARNGGADADTLREFAADDVEDPDAVDWEAAAEEVEARQN